MIKLFDRVKVNIPTTGTGDISFGAAASAAFLTPAEAGALDDDEVRYVIVDGLDFEEGVGLIKDTVATMERTVTKSKIGGVVGTSPINLSGTAVLALSASAADIGDMKGPSGATDGNIVTFDGPTGNQVKDSGTSVSSVVLSSLLNATRAANSTGSGVSADGSVFVDLLNSTATLDMDNSSNVQFMKGGIGPNSGPGSYTEVASIGTSGSNDGWNGYAIVSIVSSSIIDPLAIGRKYMRLRLRSGTGGATNFRAVFVGVADGGYGFDKAYPVVPVLFSGDDFTLPVAAGGTIDSDPFEFSIPSGKSVAISYYIASGGYLSFKSQSGLSSFYKSGENQTAKFTKAGYSGAGAGFLCVDKIEVADEFFGEMSVASSELPLEASPLRSDVLAFLDCDPADVSGFTISLSRDGMVWKPVTLSNLYTVNGMIGRIALDIDLSSGAGTGNSLFWRAETGGGKRIKITSVSIRQDGGGAFVDIPSVPLVSGPTVVTRHKEATGLGYNDGGEILYGRLWGFTQDWQVEGPTRFRVLAHINMVHLGTPISGDTEYPVAWTIPVTLRYAIDSAAMGAKQYDETDYEPPFGNVSRNWIAFDSGNILGVSEHYKSAVISFVKDVVDPGIYRFEVWGHSATSKDGTPTSGRVAVNWTEALGASARGLAYNSMEITAEPLR